MACQHTSLTQHCLDEHGCCQINAQLWGPNGNYNSAQSAPFATNKSGIRLPYAPNNYAMCAPCTPKIDEKYTPNGFKTYVTCASYAPNNSAISARYAPNNFVMCVPCAPKIVEKYEIDALKTSAIRSSYVHKNTAASAPYSAQHSDMSARYEEKNYDVCKSFSQKHPQLSLPSYIHNNIDGQVCQPHAYISSKNPSCLTYTHKNSLQQACQSSTYKTAAMMCVGIAMVLCIMAWLFSPLFLR